MSERGAEPRRYVAWEAPRVDAPAEPLPAAIADEAPAGGDPEALERLRREAQAQGRARGRQEGLAEGLREAQARVARLEEVLGLLARPLEALDETVVEELLVMTVAIARQLVRRELRTSPEAIIGVIREAAAALPVAAREVRLALHPDDAELVRQHLRPDERWTGWKIVDDPSLTPGGCRIETDQSRIDATVERRLAAIAATVLGGQRSGDDEPGG